MEGALSDIHDWHPEPWYTPGDKEISRMEALICQPGDSDDQLPVTDEGLFYHPDIAVHFKHAQHRWFTSATAAAIDSCK
jgi:hypothetical protein